MIAIFIEMKSMSSDLYSFDQTLSYSTELIISIDNKNMIMTDIMQVDLNQVFFDRVHSILPIIYHRRYFS